MGMGEPVRSWGPHGQFDATCFKEGIAGRQSPRSGNPPAVLSPQRSGSSSRETRTLRLSSPSGVTGVMGHGV
jgi:hypothetical protein